MAATPTAEEFRQHLGTRFGVRLDTPRPVELELTEVKDYNAQANEPSKMERFSLFFQGPADVYLPQNTYAFEHEGMGTHELFIVPVARNERGFRYESVFNYFRKTDG